jgi:hypothetical protein
VRTRLLVFEPPAVHDKRRALSRSQCRTLGSSVAITWLPKLEFPGFFEKIQNFLGFSLEIPEVLSIDSPSLAGKVQGD